MITFPIHGEIYNKTSVNERHMLPEENVEDLLSLAAIFLSVICEIWNREKDVGVSSIHRQENEVLPELFCNKSVSRIWKTWGEDVRWIREQISAFPMSHVAWIIRKMKKRKLWKTAPWRCRRCSKCLLLFDQTFSSLSSTPQKLCMKRRIRRCTIESRVLLQFRFFGYCRNRGQVNLKMCKTSFWVNVSFLLQTLFMSFSFEI